MERMFYPLNIGIRKEKKWINERADKSPGKILLKIRIEFLSNASGRSTICPTESYRSNTSAGCDEIEEEEEAEEEEEEAEEGEVERKEEEEEEEGKEEAEVEEAEDDEEGNSTERNNRKSSCLSEIVSNFLTILIIQAFKAKWTFSIKIHPPMYIYNQKWN